MIHRNKKQTGGYQGLETGEWVDTTGQRVQISSYETNKFWDVMYSMLTTVNSTVLYTWKLLRGQILRVLITAAKKKRKFTI